MSSTFGESSPFLQDLQKFWNEKKISDVNFLHPHIEAIFLTAKNDNWHIKKSLIEF